MLLKVRALVKSAQEWAKSGNTTTVGVRYGVAAAVAKKAETVMPVMTNQAI